MIAICKNHNKDVFYVLVCDVSGGGGFECTVCLKSYVMMIQIYISGVFGYRLFFWNWKLIVENTVDKNKS